VELTQKMQEGDEASRRGHFEKIRRVGCVHHQMFGIDIYIINGGAIRRGNIYSCFIIYTCCDMCSSCAADYFMCEFVLRGANTFRWPSEGLRLVHPR
jgi:hypothetical protein